jgi:hypothetical protein
VDNKLFKLLDIINYWLQIITSNYKVVQFQRSNILKNIVDNKLFKLLDIINY